MVAIQVCKEDSLELAEAQRRAEQLLLRALATVEEPEPTLLHELQGNAAHVARPSERASARAQKVIRINPPMVSLCPGLNSVGHAHVLGALYRMCGDSDSSL